MSEAAKALGRSLITVNYRDGTEHRFEMRQLNIEQLLQFCEEIHAGRDFALVELCTGQPKHVLNLCKPEGFAKLLAAAYQENFQEAMPLIMASPALAYKMLPVVQRLHEAARLLLISLGAESSPSPAPGGSAEATGTEYSNSLLTALGSFSPNVTETKLTAA